MRLIVVVVAIVVALFTLDVFVVIVADDGTIISLSKADELVVLNPSSKFT